jgi:hypothetical protein
VPAERGRYASTHGVVPSGGAKPYPYQWLVVDDTTCNTVGGCMTSNTFASKPTQGSASYHVGVWTRNAGNANNTSEKSAAVLVAITAVRVTSATLMARSRGR